MKKLIPFILLSLMLSGCSLVQKEKTTASAENIKNVSTISKSRAKSLGDVYVTNPQVADDTSLLLKGQTLKDEKGEVTLEDIATLNKTYSIGPIEMKIKQIKLINNLPTYSLMDYFHYYTESYESFRFVKVEVEIINHSNKQLHFGPVAHLMTSNNEVKEFKDDFYIEYLGGEMNPNSSKQGAMGFIVEHTVPSLKWIELTTSDVLDDQHKVIAKAQKIKVDLK
ncbi:DUF4352 domain-containing protein [Bacillus sp. AFS053548]|uniref:DUF4352 domain-containing protein n=1 Tax=Bacillus sp. AFS053548 TaxID=2033505 RepID=UPI000BFB88A8|nr:DUF4352 domain-containing protein [Bacillus sp. AFS053548]PGM49405.1 DUF4352 domain-containing protein [Bacillus sp. AFS053548]